MSVRTVLKINKRGKLLLNLGSCFMKVELYLFFISLKFGTVEGRTEENDLNVSERM